MKTIKKPKKSVKRTIKKTLKKRTKKKQEQCCIHCCHHSDGMSTFSAIIIFIAVIILAVGSFFIYKYMFVDQTESLEDQIADWQVYSNEEYEIKYPKDAKLVEKQDVRIALPFDQNTSIGEKYALILVKQDLDCSNPMGVKIDNTDVIYFDDLQFEREQGIQNAGDSTFEYISYSTEKNDQCFSINFVLHYVNEDFDRDKELEVINLILSTFKI